MPFSTLKALWAVRDDRALTATEQRIAVMLIAFSDETGKCWPSVGKIAEAARTSRSAVQRALKMLQAGSGPIRVTAVRRVSELGGTMPHLYQLSLEGVPHTAPPLPHTAPPLAPPVPGGVPHAEPGGCPIQVHEEDSKKKTVKEDIEESAASAVFEHWSSALFSKVHTKRKAKPTKARMDKIRARLDDEFTVDELKLVIDNVASTPFMLGDNDRGLPFIEPKTIFANSEKVETWLSKKTPNGGKVQRAADESKVKQWGRGRTAPVQASHGQTGFEGTDAVARG